MLSFQDKLNGLEAWADRQNAKDLETAKARPAMWHVGKGTLGLVVLVKGVSLGMRADGFGEYGLAALLLAGGIAVVIESAQMLRQRLAAR